MPKFSIMDKARSQLLLHYCFFASILLRLPMNDDNTIPTMCTDGKTIRYNPAFVDKLSVAETMAVLCHELYHIIFKHCLRKGKRDHMKWNVAGDYGINLLLKDQHMTLPKECLLDEKYRDMYIEKIYDKLPSMQTLQLPKGWNIGECQPTVGPNGEELGEDARDEIAKEIQGMVKEAAIAAKMAGKLPADIERMLGDLLNPKIPWREVLAKFLTVHVLSDYTWKLPNKRYVAQGIYLPRLNEPELGDLVLAVDTSGSITDKDLIDLMSEVKGILMQFPNKTMWLLGADTKVASAQEISFQDEIKKPKGGGGTCYKDVFGWVEKEGIEPVCLLYLTDGECNSFPTKVPEYPVLWVLTQDPSYYKNIWDKPPFGDVIKMDDRNQRRR